MKFKVHIGRGQSEGKGEHGVMYMYARTTARIRIDADQEHEGQGPQMRRHPWPESRRPTSTGTRTCTSISGQWRQWPASSSSGTVYGVHLGERVSLSRRFVLQPTQWNLVIFASKKRGRYQTQASKRLNYFQV